MDPVREPFLDKKPYLDDPKTYCLDETEQPPKRRKHPWLRCSPIVPHVFLILIYTTIFLLGWRSLHSGGACDAYELIHTPAKASLTYEKRTFLTRLDDNPFAGLPRPELDAAWHDLLENSNIKITAAELQQLGPTEHSIPLADGSGYLAELGAYHELHCIKRVRQYLHLDHYHPNMTAAARARELVHMDHCLEYFREAAMCRADPSLTTFGWRAADGRPTAHVDSLHQCADWGRFAAWAAARRVDVLAEGVLGRPVEIVG